MKTFGGSATCPRPCSDCDPKLWGHVLEPAGDDRQKFVDQHHFNTVYDCTTAEEEPEHPAALEGHDFWWVCKHCDAWCVDPDGDLIDSEES